MHALAIRERFDYLPGTWRTVEEPTPITCYDDGPGPLWAALDTFGIVAFMRGPRTFEQAWNLAEDVAWPDATWDDVIGAAIDDEHPTREAVEAAMNRGDLDLPEGFGFRPNGPGCVPGRTQGTYQLDLNGHDIVRIDRAFLARHKVRIVLAD